MALVASFTMSCSFIGRSMKKLAHHSRKIVTRFFKLEDGAAVVEFAIMLPLMFVVFALIAEGGRLFWSFQNVITGVRDTTRHISRIAPSDLCASDPSASISDFSYTASGELSALSTDDISVSLERLSLDCVGVEGEYRVSPVPVAVVTAKLIITELPFSVLFQLVGASALTTVETTVTDRSRVFGP